VVIVTALLAAPAFLRAQPVTDPPPRQPEAEDLIESVMPTIRTMESERGIIQEYGRRGSPYTVKISPKGAKPYYLTDPDGSGQLEWRRGSLNRELEVPQWTLKRW